MIKENENFCLELLEVSKSGTFEDFKRFMYKYNLKLTEDDTEENFKKFGELLNKNKKLKEVKRPLNEIDTKKITGGGIIATVLKNYPHLAKKNSFLDLIN
ncbi:MAG: hypothetical protein RsTaC01_0846 [Candidatus Paraimprobicoccus trichonymphae]|uniref:Uncharacterized protein n=1 Tax=Candidatus Paraimprobicoccus trichonymphae TaxID=3033793 RepID=A0AA48HX01_9FIRM|nr:MAG: hypothetical protein RsTaC01_0846 [Candidatus Paraimprobicoccus trichonymphae]